MFLKTHKQLNIRKGFTLIELLVVIVIIGILATLTTISLTSARGKARDARRISDLKQIATALELYQADNNSYPTLITGGNALASPDGAKVYMKKIPSDPSTNASYAYYGSASRFTLRTTIEKAVEGIPIGPVIVTSGGGVKQAVNSDNTFMSPDLTFGGYLIGYWPLNAANTSGNTVYDLSGNNYHGTKTAATVLTTGRFGETDGAYFFNKSGTYVNIANFPKADYLSAMTVSCWFKLNGGSGQSMSIISQGAQANSFFWLLRGANNSFSTQYFTAYSGFGNNLNMSSFTDTENWNFVTRTAANGQATFYMNSVFKSSGTYTGTFNMGNFPLSIGAYSGSYEVATHMMNGSIADCRIYNKALVASEVKELYEATRP